MDIRQIVCVMEIYKTKSITRAAEKMYLTRSSMNYILLNLEKELGVQLFHRTPNGLVPTSAGEIFLSYARRITGDMSRLKQEIGDYSQMEICHLRVGVTVGGGQPPQLDCTFTRDPVQIFLGVPPAIAEKYHLNPDSGEPVDLRLFRDEPFVVMNSNSFISDISNSYFEEAGFQPQVIMECSLMSMAATFVRNGLALAFLLPNALRADDSFSLFPVEPRRSVRSSIFFRKGTQFTRAEQHLIELVKASMEKKAGDPPENYGSE